MEFIGEHLKNVRNKKNFKLSYISKELNISSEILRLIDYDNVFYTPKQHLGGAAADL